MVNLATLRGRMDSAGLPGPAGPQGPPGIDGETPVISRITAESIPYGERISASITGPTDDLEIHFNIPEGKPGPQGLPGDAGNGIISVQLTRSEGPTDYYTIYFTDGSTFEYSVVNGMTEDGEITVDHSKLLNLDYESSGHTGFMSTKAFEEHMNAENPHRITCEMIGAAPARLEALPETDITNAETSERTNIMAEQNGVSTRISLNSLKNMNTKIVSVDSDADIRKQDLSTDDFVYVKNE